MTKEIRSTCTLLLRDGIATHDGSHDDEIRTIVNIPDVVGVENYGGEYAVLFSSVEAKETAKGITDWSDSEHSDRELIMEAQRNENGDFIVYCENDDHNQRIGSFYSKWLLTTDTLSIDATFNIEPVAKVQKTQSDSDSSSYLLFYSVYAGISACKWLYKRVVVLASGINQFNQEVRRRYQGSLKDKGNK